MHPSHILALDSSKAVSSNNAAKVATNTLPSSSALRYGRSPLPLFPEGSVSDIINQLHQH